MAYRRSIIARSKFFYQQHQQFSPSLTHFTASDREQLPAKRNPEMFSNFLISRNNVGNSRLMRSEVPADYGLLSGNVSRLMRSEVPSGYGLVFHRNMSKVPSDIEVPADDFNGVVGVLAEKAVEAAPVVNEVATAAAGSISNLNIIDFVHCYTGFFKQLDPIQSIDAVTPRFFKYAAVEYAVIVAVAARLPTAAHFLVITYNLTSIAYANVMIHPRVQKLLGISLNIPRSAGK